MTRRSADSNVKAGAVGYVRVSSAGQADGQSLDTQRTSIKAAAVALELELLEVHQDVASGSSVEDRPGLESALTSTLAAPGRVLVVSRLDRASRSLRDLLSLLERLDGAGCGLVAVGDAVDTRSPAGRLVVSILAVVAEWERGRVVERIREGMRKKVEQGGYTGGPIPWGYRLEAGELVEEPAELRLIAAVSLLRRRGLGYRRIAAALERRGFLDRQGRPVGVATVRVICERRGFNGRE